MLTPIFMSTGKTTLTVTRRGSGSRVAGRWVADPTPTSHTITANVQPGLSWNAMQFLPEGERGKQAIRVYTAFELRQRREGASGWDADTFIWDGYTYKVVHVPPAYKMGILNHTRAICVRVEVT